MSEVALRSDIAGFTHDPLGFCRYVYPWGEGELEKHPGPRAWQADILATIGKHLQNPSTRFQPLRIAVASGHGIGKSANIAQIMHWAMSTCEDCRIIVTANTDTQLRTKTWPEVKKWFRLAINSHWFDPTATAVFVKDKKHDDWRADAIPWSDSNPEAFAGLHNQGKRIVVIMDEASSISDKIWEVIDGALTDEDTEIIFIAYGNPTRATGSFRECFRRNKHRWVTKQIDSRTVEGTNKVEIDNWIEDNGIDSDYVKIRVRGIFPNMSAKQFLAEADVDKAFGGSLKPGQYDFAPKILTCDPAWEGDDALEIGLRQGLAFRLIRTIPRNDNDIEMAQILAQIEDDEMADAVFVDAGYGTGIVSAGHTWGRGWELVWFGGGSPDPGCLNMRAYMAIRAKKWFKDGGVIPANHELRDDCLSVETVARTDGKVQLESKTEVKKRLGRSPGKFDSLLLSFYRDVSKKMEHIHPALAKRGATTVMEYDPYEGRD